MKRLFCALLCLGVHAPAMEAMKIEEKVIATSADGRYECKLFGTTDEHGPFWDKTDRMYVFVYDTHAEQRVGFPVHGHEATFSPDGRYLAVHEYPNICLYKIDSILRQIGEPMLNHAEWGPSPFSPNSQFLCVGNTIFGLLGWNLTVTLYRTLDGRQIGKPITGTCRAKFSTDSKLLSVTDKLMYSTQDMTPVSETAADDSEGSPAGPELAQTNPPKTDRKLSAELLSLGLRHRHAADPK